MVYGLKKYRQHLLGRKIVVCTDHAAFTFLKKTPEPISQQGRWLDLLSEYQIDIEHRPGHVHSNSDARTRRIPARLLSRVHAHWGESEFSFGRQSPSCSVVLQSLQCSISDLKRVN